MSEQRIIPCPRCDGVGVVMIDQYGQYKLAIANYGSLSRFTRDALVVCKFCNGCGMLSAEPYGEQRAYMRNGALVFKFEIGEES